MGGGNPAPHGVMCRQRTRPLQRTCKEMVRGALRRRACGGACWPGLASGYTDLKGTLAARPGGSQWLRRRARPRATPESGTPPPRPLRRRPARGVIVGLSFLSVLFGEVLHALLVGVPVQKTPWYELACLDERIEVVGHKRARSRLVELL